MLRKTLSIILFVAFTARPAYYVGYLAYFELNIDSIIEKYCVNKNKPELSCNGKCHLKKQFQSAQQKGDSNKAIVNLSESFFPLFYNGFFSVTIQKDLKNKLQKHLLGYTKNYIYLFEDSQFKPPEV